MGLIEAAGWGLAGGVVAALVALTSWITEAGYKWPDHLRGQGLSPGIVVVAAGLIISTIVAAAAHAQMTGAWPALIMGTCAPSVVRNILANVEVAERMPEDPSR